MSLLSLSSPSCKCTIATDNKFREFGWVRGGRDEYPTKHVMQPRSRATDMDAIWPLALRRSLT